MRFRQERNIAFHVRVGSIASSLTSLRHVRSGGNLGNGGRPVRARRRRAYARPDAPWLRQNNATGKITLNLSGKSGLPARPVLSRQEGRIAIVTNAGGDAVDAAASARKCVRRAVFRERARRAGRTTQARTAKPCGSDTRCWCQAAGGEFDPTGFDSAIKPAVTVTRRIRRRGERGISRKAIARGMPECFR